MMKTMNVVYFVFTIIMLIHGTQRCKETKTVSALMKNIFRYYSKNTKCKHIIPYNQTPRNPIQQVLEEIYSINICDENIGEYIPVMTQIFNKIDEKLKIMTYFSTKNYETDIKTIMNDAEICYNNVVNPIVVFLSFFGFCKIINLLHKKKG